MRVRPTGECGAVGAEAVAVAGGRAQSAYVGLDGVVGRGGGAGDVPERDDLTKRGVLGDLPARRDGRALPGTGHGVGGGGDAGPQQDAVGQRVAGGDAVQEGGAGRRRGPGAAAGGGGEWRRGRSGRDGGAAAAAAFTTVRRGLVSLRDSVTGESHSGVEREKVRANSSKFARLQFARRSRPLLLPGQRLLQRGLVLRGVPSARSGRPSSVSFLPLSLMRRGAGESVLDLREGGRTSRSPTCRTYRPRRPCRTSALPFSSVDLFPERF